MSEMQAGLLLHSIDWSIRESEIEIVPQVWVCRTAGSRIGQLYENLCYDTGLDQSEPLRFKSHLLLAAAHPGVINSMDRTYDSPLVRLSNIIAIVLQEPIGLSRVVMTEDGFNTCTETDFLHMFGDMTEFLSDSEARPGFAAEAFVDLDRAWRVAEASWIGNPAGSRLVNALARYELAWRDATLPNLLLNLGISLAFLFPGMRPEERCENLASVFDDAQIRANIAQFFENHRGFVEGCTIGYEQSYSPELAVYKITGLLLKTILLDEKLAKYAEEGSLRAEYVFSPETAESFTELILRAIKNG